MWSFKIVPQKIASRLVEEDRETLLRISRADPAIFAPPATLERLFQKGLVQLSEPENFPSKPRTLVLTPLGQEVCRLVAAGMLISGKRESKLRG